MTALDWYGAAALGAILLTFYAVREIRGYVAACAAILLAFTWLTRQALQAPAEWIVLAAGLGLCVFGLLIVRLMLMRSVSLNLLRRLQASLQDEFGEDIGSRLRDMRGLRLVQTEGEQISLTGFGQLVSKIVTTTYTLFGIKG